MVVLTFGVRNSKNQPQQAYDLRMTGRLERKSLVPP
jgi:hypothetical protein